MNGHQAAPSQTKYRQTFTILVPPTVPAHSSAQLIVPAQSSHPVWSRRNPVPPPYRPGLFQSLEILLPTHIRPHIVPLPALTHQAPEWPLSITEKRVYR